MPVRDFLLDEKGDRVVANGDWQLASDRQAVMQGIRIRVRFVQGDNWMNEADGLPWFTVILAKGASLLVAQALVRRAIASTPDVRRVVAIAITRDANRQATASYTVIDAYSADALSGETTSP